LAALKDFEIDTTEDLGGFDRGLFAASEMFVDSFLELYRNGILKKKVYDSRVIQYLLNEKRISEKVEPHVLDELHKERAIHTKITQKDFDFLKDFGVFRNDLKFDSGRLVFPDGMECEADLADAGARARIDQNALGSCLRNGAVAHAGFFLGCQSFYQFLRDLPIEERKLIRMKRISQINHLYGHEEMDRLQRKNGRFINTTMKVSLNGAASSDGLEDLTQISGVGGQYNFVAMAHELHDGRSILQLRSTRTCHNGKVESNIVLNYGNCTIPRHLRDTVVTEYGIADIRGKTDEETAIRLIQIADSRFQDKLIREAKRVGKLGSYFRLDERYRQNLPSHYQVKLRRWQKRGFFSVFPLGHDFTEEELLLAKALKKIQAISRKKRELVPFLVRSLLSQTAPQELESLLDRMDLRHPKNMMEKVYQRLLIRALRCPTPDA